MNNFIFLIATVVREKSNVYILPFTFHLLQTWLPTPAFHPPFQIEEKHENQKKSKPYFPIISDSDMGVGRTLQQPDNTSQHLVSSGLHFSCKNKDDDKHIKHQRRSQKPTNVR